MLGGQLGVPGKLRNGARWCTETAGSKGFVLVIKGDGALRRVVGFKVLQPWCHDVTC